MRQIFRLGFLCLVLLSFSSSVSCFGDNAKEDGEEEEELPDGVPGVLEISGPADIDLGDSFDVTVKVKGKANEQLSVVVDASLGTFATQSKLLITDEAGEGSFTTRYTSSMAGAENLRANVAVPSTTGSSKSRALTIFDIERLGNVAPVATASAQTEGVLIAYPMELTTARTVRKLGITHPTQSPSMPVNAHVGLYTTLSPTSISVLAKTTVALTAGQNEIVIPPQDLPAGKYWMVVLYEGAPSVYRSTTVQVTLMYKLGQVYSAGLADQITDLSTSSATVTYYLRNFYLVLRK